MYRIVVITATAMLGAGCASLPNVTYRYFGPQASTSVKLVRTIACDRDSKLIEAHAPLVTTTYAADPAKEHLLHLSKLRGAFIDSDVKLEWYEDGRLKSINQTTTGQGETILKAALGAVAGSPSGGALPLTQSPECQLVNRLGRGKPISLSYRPQTLIVDNTPTGLGYAKGSPRLLVPNDDYDQHVHDLLKDKLQVLYVQVESVTSNKALADYTASNDPDARQVGIALYGASTVNYVFLAEVKGGSASQTRVLARDTALIPNKEPYSLPIPRPALFGKQGFALSLSESGQISSSAYTSTSGTAGALGAVGMAHGATRSKSAAQRAALAEGEADLIAQEQRLLRCRLAPESCN